MTRLISTIAPAALRFETRILDRDPRLLDDSYRLRYQVYCHERAFLPAHEYPDGLETDVFDEHAIHVGAIDEYGELAGTARLILPNPLGFPVTHHCELHAAFEEQCGRPSVIELSRLCVSRSYARRHGDGAYGDGAPEAMPPGDRRRLEGGVFLSVIRAVYEVSLQLNVTHWLAAAEPSLHRIFVRRGFPFKPVGPGGDYFGLVFPYLMDLREFEANLATRRIPALVEFANALDGAVEERVDREGRRALPAVSAL